MSHSVEASSQQLAMEPIIELWELDTSSLTNIYGEAGTGQVYCWTPGVLEYRIEGTLTQTSTTSTIVLDRVVQKPNPVIGYQFQVGIFNTGSDSMMFTQPPSPITGWADDGVHTTITVSPALPNVPTATMPWLIKSEGSVWFRGVKYTSLPVEVTEMSWAGRGTLPRPRLKVSNVGGLATALVVQFGDIMGATVTRLQTFRSFLDGEPNADASMFFEPDVFVVDRKSHHSKDYIEFELASALDQAGIMLPKRVVVRDACDQSYRQWSTAGGSGHFVYGSCPWRGTPYFTEDGTQSVDPTKDVCGKRMSDCTLRFGQNGRLPFHGFPGVSQVAL